MTTKTFTVDVDGVGRFVFRQRQIRDTLRIEAETCRILGGPLSDPIVADYVHSARCMATLALLTVQAPDGWSIDQADPFDDEAFAILWKVHAGLRQQEDSFRSATAT
ncbi:MAG: hypothetical protein P4M00_05190 [Azospirillaceae bacterium]|nr:hypothetical protein [Azospirillaceae bacterium]